MSVARTVCVFSKPQFSRKHYVLCYDLRSHVVFRNRHRPSVSIPMLGQQQALEKASAKDTHKSTSFSIVAKRTCSRLSSTSSSLISRMESIRPAPNRNVSRNTSHQYLLATPATTIQECQGRRATWCSGIYVVVRMPSLLNKNANQSKNHCDLYGFLGMVRRAPRNSNLQMRIELIEQRQP